MKMNQVVNEIAEKVAAAEPPQVVPHIGKFFPGCGMEALGRALGTMQAVVAVTNPAGAIKRMLTVNGKTVFVTTRYVAGAPEKQRSQVWVIYDLDSRFDVDRFPQLAEAAASGLFTAEWLDVIMREE